MFKLSDQQVVIFSVFLFALIYIAIHTNVVGALLVVIRPFINGFILAYLIGILVTPVEVKIPLKSARGLSIFMVYLLLVSGLAVLLVYIAPILTENLQLFVLKLPTYLAQSQVLNGSEFFETFSLSEVTSQLFEGFLSFTQYARKATSGVVSGFLSVIVSIYVLLTKEAILKFGNRLANALIPNHAPKLRQQLNKSHVVVVQFLVAQLVASAILGLVVGVVLSLFNVSYAILIAVIIGMLNIIPLFGTLAGTALATLIMFLTNPPMLALIGFVFLLLLQQIDATIITPKLMGNVLNLNPIIVLLALTLGATYFGLMGILFAVPVAVILRELISEKIHKS